MLGDQHLVADSDCIWADKASGAGIRLNPPFGIAFCPGRWHWIGERALERHKRGPVNPETFAAGKTGIAQPVRAVIGFYHGPKRFFRFATS
jgi:hypothetical protein